jgi:hypothetical protein
MKLEKMEKKIEKMYYELPLYNDILDTDLYKIKLLQDAIQSPDEEIKLRYTQRLYYLLKYLKSGKNEN